MHLGRRKLIFVAGVALVLAAWTLVRPGGFEVAVLRTFDGHSDSFTSLWVIDDPEQDFVWIRAHRPDRRWLVQIEANPQVELRRNGRSAAYVARVFDDDASRSYVAAGFRKKYGLADWFRELVEGRDTVPVRLRSR